MTRRRPPTILDFFPRDEIDDRTWTIREHSRLRKQWRAIRRLPVIVQILLALGVLAYVDIVATITWLVVGGLTMR
jgi:hypothetical protein